MKATRRAGRLACGLLVSSLLLLPGACAVEGGYGYDDVGLGVGYYEPFGFDYGGWGPGYRVGPPRGGEGRGRGGAGRGYRAAPEGRAMPSIPSGARSGGGRGGKRR
jgi:squid-like protein/heterogeneous nuclear ribonucleoprotein A1/A3